MLNPTGVKLALYSSQYVGSDIGTSQFCNSPLQVLALKLLNDGCDKIPPSRWEGNSMSISWFLVK